MDCLACRSSRARVCAACVAHAWSERRARLLELAHEKARLEAAMRHGLDARRKRLSRRDALRKHAEWKAAREAEIAAVRKESDHLARRVNELRHALRRAREIQQQYENDQDEQAQMEGRERANAPVSGFEVGGSKACDAEASVSRRITEARRKLLQQLSQFHDTWEAILLPCPEVVPEVAVVEAALPDPLAAFRLKDSLSASLADGMRGLAARAAAAADAVLLPSADSPRQLTAWSMSSSTPSTSTSSESSYAQQQQVKRWLASPLSTWIPTGLVNGACAGSDIGPCGVVDAARIGVSGASSASVQARLSGRESA